MTNDYKAAYDAIKNRVIFDNPDDDWKYLAIAIAPYQQTILSALQLAQEAEQVRNRLAELEALLAQANNKIKWYERTEATND